MAKNTKEQILVSALELFSEKGYLGATTKDIAARAGVSEVTLFRHFQTKENLFIKVIEHFSFLPKLKKLTLELEDKPVEDSLKLLARAFLERLRVKKALIRIILSELPRYPEIIKESYHKIIEDILKELSLYFKKLQERGLLRETIPSQIFAQAFLGLFFSYFHSKEIKGFNFQEGLTEEEITQYFVDIFLKGVLRETKEGKK